MQLQLLAIKRDVNNKLAAVDGNQPHGGGSLNAANQNVFIGNILVVIQGNSAAPR